MQTYQATVTLTDGSTLRLRAITPDDVERLLDFFYRLSRHSVYLRFHHVLTHLPREEAERFCAVDGKNSFALVATITKGEEVPGSRLPTDDPHTTTIKQDSAEKIVASGRYYRLPASDEAEIAFTVEDTYQKKGIGTLLLHQLAAIARKHGIRRFQADVLTENHDMIKVLEESGFQVTEQCEGEICRMELNITEC